VDDVSGEGARARSVEVITKGARRGDCSRATDDRGIAMGERTVVDTAAIEAAAVAVSRASHEVLASSAGVLVASRVLTTALAGSVSASASGPLGEAGAGALSELARSVEDLGTVLALVAMTYADAESSSTLSVAGAPAVQGP
jgi:hypothetical protein